MSKKVNTGARIVLGGEDISEFVVRWSVGAAIGDLYVAEIDLIDTRSVIVIEQDAQDNRANILSGMDLESITGKQQYIAGAVRTGGRVPLADVIKVKGVDVSAWISGYDRLTRVCEADVIRLHVQCDSEVLSINGSTPWEEKVSA